MTTLEETRRRGVEHTGVEIVSEHDRTARPRDLFWPWFAANVSVLGVSYAASVLGFGISVWQGLGVAVVGIVVSFALCGVIAVAGKRGSAPTMILSRAAFGVRGQKLPGLISWLVSIGWGTFLAIMAVLATATVFGRLGWASGGATKLLATAVVAGLILAVSMAGYHVIVRMYSVLTWITGAVTVGYIALTVRYVDLGAVAAIPAGSRQQVIGALVMVMTGFGLGWINIAADWSRYQSRHTSGVRILAWNTAGGALAPLALVCFGLLLAGSSEAIRDGVAADPIGTLAMLLPRWSLIPFWIAALLALVSGAVLAVYSSGLTLLSLGVRVSRPSAAGVGGVVLIAGTAWVVFFAEDFLGPFQSFLITLGVPVAAWAGILIADIVLRRRDYDEAALFDPAGRYGAWDWISLLTMAGACTIGWGLVVNTFAEDVAWNSWQGYLIEPLGLGTWVADGGYWDGLWAQANLGVLLALVLSFAIALGGRRTVVRRQEAGQVDH